ncbi:MAG: phosphoribosylformylglycinamidine synthase subunit PurQ [Pirellulales bacterium]
MKPRVLILRAPGTNCDEESAHAFALAGGVPERWHVNRLLESPAKLAEFQILCLPGGFSYGDDIAAGRILGNQIEHHLAGVLREFRDAGKLVIGICNGFQILLKTELLVAKDAAGPQATLAANASGKFEDRWVNLAVSQPNGSNKCVFLSGIEALELPVAHGEGRFVPRDENVLESLRANGQLVLKYAPLGRAGASSPPSAMNGAEDGPARASGQTSVPYPQNPNGAIDDVAGLCDATGRVFGLMPHPERFVDPTQHPNWTRGPKRDVGAGLRIFQNAVRYFA